MNGNNLLQCYEVVNQCGKEVEAMFSLIDVLVSQTFSDPEFVKGRFSLGKRMEWEQWTGWIASDWAYSYPLKKTGQGVKLPTAWLSFQVSLFGEGTLVPKLDSVEPLLHVSLWAEPISDEAYVGFPFDDEENLEVEVSRLAQWKNEDTNSLPSWFNRAWTYSLRLVKLNTEDDLKKWIMEPIKKLMNGESADIALPSEPSAEPVWIVYPEKELLVKEP